MGRLNVNKNLKSFIPDSFKRRDVVTFSGHDKRALWKIKLTKIDHEDIFDFSLL